MSCLPGFLRWSREHKRRVANDFSANSERTSSDTSSGQGQHGASSSNPSLEHKPLDSMIFTMAELKRMTANFSAASKIGQGGCATVYRGKLPDGRIIAIKRTKKEIFANGISKEFENEVEKLSAVEHLNLVKLIGHLEADNERILVTEFVPNGNLRQHLDGDLGVTLDMSKRLDIAIDVAHALAYLHFYADNPIIHRDVKSSNILLSETFRAKVADFGFSRMGPAGDASASCVLTQLKGTAGYLDPEYLKTNMLNVKSDVYSFGILLIELFSGRRPLELNRPSDERITLLWAFRCLTAGNLTAVLDPNIEKTPAVMGILERLFELAFSCSAPTRNDRPNMKKAQAALWNIRKAYQAKIDHQREKLEDEKDENSVARVKTKANVDLASPRTRSSRPSDNIESARATRLNRRNEQEHSAKASSNHGAENQEGVRSRRQSESKNIRQPSEAGCSEGTAATEGLSSNYPAENLDSPADQNLDSPPTATVIR